MIVSFTNRFVYIAVPRTASTSIYNAVKAAGAEHLRYRQPPFPCYSKDFNGFHDPFVPPELDSYFRFATFRNPYTRMVSHYMLARGDEAHRLHGLATNKDFPHFVEVAIAGRLLTTQVEFMSGTKVDAMLAQEGNVYDQVQVLPPFCDIRLVITPANYSEYEYPWYAYYDSATIASVCNWAAEDFVQLGYSTSFEDAIGLKLPVFPPTMKR